MDRLLDGLGVLVDAVVVLIGTALIAIVLANVVLHLFASDLAWVTELGELLMVWVTFLGGVAAARRNAHMAITELLDKLPVRARRVADVAVQSLCLALLVLLFVGGVRIVSGGFNSVLTTLDIPTAWQYMPLPVAALLMFVFHLRKLVHAVRGRADPPRAAAL